MKLGARIGPNFVAVSATRHAHLQRRAEDGHVTHKQAMQRLELVPVVARCHETLEPAARAKAVEEGDALLQGVAQRGELALVRSEQCSIARSRRLVEHAPDLFAERRQHAAVALVVLRLPAELSRAPDGAENGRQQPYTSPS